MPTSGILFRWNRHARTNAPHFEEHIARSPRGNLRNAAGFFRGRRFGSGSGVEITVDGVADAANHLPDFVAVGSAFRRAGAFHHQ